mmetsp:Transcript_71984/g.171872  ORF Transcript_71984/g.171872 Transcript_71984/m.171872 type:complete len:213 (+) Transcript_71984:324-962(+)
MTHIDETIWQDLHSHSHQGASLPFAWRQQQRLGLVEGQKLQTAGSLWSSGCGTIGLWLLARGSVTAAGCWSMIASSRCWSSSASNGYSKIPCNLCVERWNNIEVEEVADGFLEIIWRRGYEAPQGSQQLYSLLSGAHLKSRGGNSLTHQSACSGYSTDHAAKAGGYSERNSAQVGSSCTGTCAYIGQAHRQRLCQVGTSSHLCDLQRRRTAL